MNFILTLNSIELSSLILVTAVILLAFCTLLVNRNLTKENADLRQSINQLQNEIRVINSGHLGMGREIRKVSREVAEQDTVQQTSHINRKNHKVYEQAGLLLSHGASFDEVIDSFNIAPAEVELMATMNKLSSKNNDLDNDSNSDLDVSSELTAMRSPA